MSCTTVRASRVAEAGGRRIQTQTSRWGWGRGRLEGGTGGGCSGGEGREGFVASREVLELGEGEGKGPEARGASGAQPLRHKVELRSGAEVWRVPGAWTV